MKRSVDVQRKLDRIFSSQAQDINRMAEGFHTILELHLTDSAREIELLQALGDRENLVKTQIKHSTLQHVLKVFDDCYFRTTNKTWQPDVEDRDE